MKLTDFDFDLPDDLIATRPAAPRSSARMMVVQPDRTTDARVTDLTRWLRPGDRLILNDTKVIPARLDGERVRETRDGSGRARCEFTLLEARPDGAWRALGKPLRKLREGDRIEFSHGLTARVAGKDETEVVLAFDGEGEALQAALDAAGQMPLPPYIAAKRPPDARDREDYQSIWARHSGAVAAPTASLHFDAPLLEALRARGVAFSEVTLHVGAGTFLPVKVEDVTTHRMHAEWGNIDPEVAEAIARTKAEGGRVIPVGTTALRLIETAARGGAIAPFRGETDIFIYPGFTFRAADGLITNFHLPQSTLLMLVSAMMGRDRMLAAYAHAVRERYRFFSYGDASLLLPNGA
ncbi:tRNA preQ1(34) S-adenosylmethionine ribosyltransferase-isomerase QueA [Jannaschia seohaensis]|uniref:S-adenosylmethionine:tRNA ribosyltransferase-isomerase n=1 Tax=Jannaschia seohaensis TaxID=475081 RepID=A0A2Y9B4A5_9RHOB|nr:tRNA preQ1(34) S-adenosylmethionine ribosyltransferase-isomerase QueA [Jannaschia seohaensis]PWJ12138.1 S-adenosylmethionine:tRNA ribosyltransferase-isomerase [Jannaschia seohaensis]SSA51241.1 S-adenosylmethionine:tRNA ribosyltransferase-isomerase [Jannaschia seohaensis]